MNACSDLDEEHPPPEVFFDSEYAYVSFLGTAYTPLHGYMTHGNYFSLQEVSSDEGIIPVRGRDWFTATWVKMHRHQFDSNDYPFNDVWNMLYRGITVCNQKIEFLEGMNNEQAMPYVAEVRALRALYYYWLLDLFGNIPIVTKFDFPEYFLPTTTERADVFDFVEGEVLAVLDGLPREVGLTTYGRMHYYAAQALLSALYLNADVYKGVAEWRKAVMAADEIINSGAYRLEADYFQNFVTDNEGSAENVFSIPYDENQATGFNQHMASLHYASQATFELQNQPWNGFCSSQEFYESFDEEDVRKKSFLEGPQFAADGSIVLDPEAEENDPDGPPLTFTPTLTGLDAPGSLRQEGVRIGKFEIKRGAGDNLSNDMPVFRYAEILLNKAEALWRLNPEDPEALILVNQIRERAGVPPIPMITAENLLAERGRELVFEAKRRTDLIRFNVFGESWEFKEASEPCKTLFPIPRAQLEAGSNLRQNPCYN